MVAPLLLGIIQFPNKAEEDREGILTILNRLEYDGELEDSRGFAR